MPTAAAGAAGGANHPAGWQALRIGCSFPLTILSVLVLVCALWGASPEGAAGAEHHESRYATVSAAQWSSLDGPCNRFESPRAFLDEVDDYVVLISSYLGRPAWRERYGSQGKIEFFHEPDGYCHVEGGYYHFQSPVLRVHLNESFRNGRAPLAHEITHLILPDYSSLSLREGLASEMQDRFGRNSALYSLGADVHALSAGFLPRAPRRVVEALGRPGIPEVALVADEDGRAFFYILSHSFARYLLDRFGVAAFLRLYESRDLLEEYPRVTGRGLEALKSEWQGFIVLRGTPDRHVAAACDETARGAGTAAEGRPKTGDHPGPL